MRAMDDLLAAALGQVSVQDERGAPVRLGDFWVKRPVVLALVRHLGCLFCRQHVAGLMRHLPEIEGRGAALVVVGPSRPEHIAGFRSAMGYAGPLFVDPALRAFRAAVRCPSVPGERSGNSQASSSANWTAVSWSKKGWERGGVSASGLPTLKAATSTGTATTSQAAR